MAICVEIAAITAHIPTGFVSLSNPEVNRITGTECEVFSLLFNAFQWILLTQLHWLVIPAKL